jgi:hypothetical protein
MTRFGNIHLQLTELTERETTRIYLTSKRPGWYLIFFGWGGGGWGELIYENREYYLNMKW